MVWLIDVYCLDNSGKRHIRLLVTQTELVNKISSLLVLFFQGIC